MEQGIYVLDRSNLYTFNETANAIGHSYDRVREWVKTGKIRSVAVSSRRRMIPHSEIERIASIGKSEVSHEAARIVALEQEVASLKKALVSINAGEQPSKLPPFLAAAGDQVRMMGPLHVYPSCVYFLMLDSEIVYVGKTVNLQSRMAEHIRTKAFDQVFYIPCQEPELTSLEAACILYLKPRLNGLTGVRSVRISEVLARAGFQLTDGVR